MAFDDNLTNRNNGSAETTLQFEITGVTPGAEVRVFSDGTLVGMKSASSTVVTVVTDGFTILSDATHSITATQSLLGAESGASTALAVAIDTAAPIAPLSIAPTVAPFDEVYTFDADSPDEGQTGVTYSLANAPSGMSILPVTGLISWTPTIEQAGPLTFGIQVSDEAGNATAQAVELTVLGVIPARPNEYTMFEDETLTVNAATGVLANDGDANLGTLTVTVVDQPTSGVR